MKIVVEQITTPDENNDYILATVRFHGITNSDNITESVRVSVTLPSVDEPLSVIRQKAINDAKRILSALLNQLES